ncbi:MAG: helix-turn-helix domain-containing protein, partial [Lachnospiraceae bacterium]|nr:helix-turn-helix domain-containing protein [Lachnospiraceae bacterium]
MPDKTFAERLRDSMVRQNIKQVDLIRIAAEQGVKLGKSHVSQYVSGKTVPRPDMIRFLAEALQVDELWLGGDGAAAGSDADAASAEPSGSHPEDVEIKVSGGKTMREFKKSSKLDNVLYDVRGPVVE